MPHRKNKIWNFQPPGKATIKVENRKGKLSIDITGHFWESETERKKDRQTDRQKERKKERKKKEKKKQKTTFDTEICYHPSMQSYTQNCSTVTVSRCQWFCLQGRRTKHIHNLLTGAGPLFLHFWLPTVFSSSSGFWKVYCAVSTVPSIWKEFKGPLADASPFWLPFVKLSETACYGWIWYL